MTTNYEKWLVIGEKFGKIFVTEELYHFSNAILRAQRYFKTAKRKPYTVQEKLEAITRVKQRGELKLMCLEIMAFQNQDFVVGLGMNKKWVILLVRTMDSSDGMKINKSRTPNVTELDKALCGWFVKERHLELSLQKQIHKQIHFHRCLFVHMHL